MKCPDCNKRMKFIGNSKSFLISIDRNINFRINWCGKCEVIKYKSSYLDKLSLISTIENKEETGILIISNLWTGL